MISIAEEASALDTILNNCAAFYEAEVDNTIDGLRAIIKPLFMAALGALLGGLMIVMCIPISRIKSIV